jgi:hypothetical protein
LFGVFGDIRRSLITSVEMRPRVFAPGAFCVFPKELYMTQPTRRAAKRDEVFFTALQNGHSIGRACEAAGYGRATVYRWRETDDTFAAAWLRALNVAADLLEEEADRRGRDGFDEPVFYQGEQRGAKRRYSDTLLLARLRALRPAQYRDGAFTQQTVNIVVRDFIKERAEAAALKANAPAALPPAGLAKANSSSD